MSTHTIPSEPCLQEASWQLLLDQLPRDLDALATREAAYVRHRGFTSAADLLRVILAYACGLSMPVVTAWAALAGMAHVTPEALHGRLKTAQHWLATLVAALLTDLETVPLLQTLGRLIVMDGTHATRPGVRSQDWRAHLTLNLHTAMLADARVTSQHTGESFHQTALHAGDLALGDRNFGKRPNIWQALQAGADVLVRCSLKTLSFYTLTGDPLPLRAHLAQLAPAETAAWDVWLTPGKAPTRTPAIRGRVIASRLDPAHAQQATQQHRRRRQRSGRAPASASTAHGWQYVLLFTTVPSTRLSPEVALALSRLRWQIEMAIKRYKSLCGFGVLHTRTDACCQTVLWAKLLLILLLERTARTAGLFPP